MSAISSTVITLMHDLQKVRMFFHYTFPIILNNLHIIIILYQALHIYRNNYFPNSVIWQITVYHMLTFLDLADWKANFQSLPLI